MTEQEQLARKSLTALYLELPESVAKHHHRIVIDAFDSIKAANNIELKQPVNGSKNLCGWVSVKDKLPEAGIVVLVSKKIIEDDDTFARLRTLADIDIDGRWFKGITQLHGVTHWQYLPENPSDGG